ncbi:MAG: hypothetical protein ICV69_07070 [Thermoleophilaceae bacterium]|nr:hypothetical protein [Thermoleophilaceae bacterium]
MASSPRSEREEERRLNLRTLVIASTASATAAAVTSQLWIAGTWIAAAVTPVLVTVVSELLERPTDKLARAWTSDRPALEDPAAPGGPVRVPRPAEAARERRAEPPRTARARPESHVTDRRTEPVSEPDRSAPRPGTAGPVRVYRQPGGRPRRRRIAYGAVAATAAIAFVIGVVAFTATELIAGEPIGKAGGRTTIGIGGGGGGGKKQPDADEEQRAPADQRERPSDEERPSTTPEEEDEETPTVTETVPAPTTPEETPGEVAPRQQPPSEEAPAAPQGETAPAP